MEFKFTVFAILHTIFLVYMSSIPGQPILGKGSSSDQIISNFAHIPAFALLGFLWLKAFSKMLINDKQSLINKITIVCLILFAVSDEIHQSFVAGRTASAFDFILDLIGIFFGYLIFKVLV